MRIMVILSALLMQLCLGATYSWSVYVQHIKNILGISQAQAQVPFSVFYFVFPLTMIFSGTLVDKFGPRIAAISGGILFGSGWLLSSLGGSNFTYTVLGNGIIAGVGAGIAYIVPIATCIKWFPTIRGWSPESLLPDSVAVQHWSVPLPDTCLNSISPPLRCSAISVSHLSL